MGKGYRQGRLGEEIRKIVSELLLRKLQDPGFSAMISVTAVEVTSDGSYATVYLSVLNANSQKNEKAEQYKALGAMKRAKGFIRNEIGRQVKLRYTPELIFKIDHSIEYGRHISKIIQNLDINHKE